LKLALNFQVEAPNIQRLCAINKVSQTAGHLGGFYFDSPSLLLYFESSHMYLTGLNDGGTVTRCNYFSQVS
jgi:hypothetical protein